MLKHLPKMLVGVLLALTFNACAHEHSEAAASAPVATEAGKNYFLIDPPQPTASGDKIEVLEIFSYACIHCAHFQPYADEIKSKLPAYAQFGYMPAIFNDQWEAFARAFYTAQAMGVQEKTQQAMFDAIHRDRRTFRSFGDIATFYGEHGVDVEKFSQIAYSFEIESKLARSKEMVPKLGVDGTPSLIVNGKYRITGASAGGYPQAVALVEYLVKKEHEAMTAAKAKK
ncbi:thiol:disulfide interchange protein DsbA/DsbL [Dokdonella sp.]|uniref:thiol:disulfide interchange protein DsbA/DsbL n=1 Tax=Dokdonella sp. TaxID=2291710 RepID=UPI003C368ABA